MPTLFNHPEDTLRAWPGRISVHMRKPRFSMASSGRGSGFFHLPDGPRDQQVVVKPQVISADKKGGKHWFGHGAYLHKHGERGFNQDGTEASADKTLGQWQKTDPHYFSLIVSPEFGDRLDMQEYTQALMEQINQDLGIKTQWVAVVHAHTDHPHVHISIRGREADGRPLQIDPEYLWGGIRQRARELATERVGWRTKEEVDRMRDRAVTKRRWTHLDHELSERMVGRKIDGSGLMSPHELRRLEELERRGFAWKEGDDWRMSLWWENTLQVVETRREYKTREQEHEENRRRTRVRIIDDLEHGHTL
jgi:hypothetical protein